MRFWIFYISFFALILFPISALANSETPEYCGGSYEYKDTYYPILDQYIIKDSSLWPFLHCPYNDLCEDRAWDGFSDNVLEWQGFFGKDFSTAEVTQLIYGKDLLWYEELQQKKTPSNDPLLAKKIAAKKFKSFIRYMVLAKKSEGLSSNASATGQGWYQGENQVAEDPKPELMAMALQLLSQEKDAFIKNRYGFQLVRLSHYLGKNMEAIRYFKKLMHLTPETHYSYYLALEQKSGAAYNLGEYKEAAEGYLTVYDELPSRRKSCALSLRLLDWSSEELKTGISERYAAAHFFKAYHARGDVGQEMLALEKENPDSPYLEVLAIREVDKLQEHLFAHTSDYWGDFQKKDRPQTIGMISKIATRLTTNKKVKNTDFWRLVRAVIAIDTDDIPLAKEMVSAITTESPFYEHAQRVYFALAVHNVKNIDRDQIEILFQRLKKDAALFKYAPMNAFFFNHIASLYVEEGNMLMGDFGYIPYYNRSQEALKWGDVTNSLGSTLKLSAKYNYVDNTVLKQFQQTLALTDKTEYEQLILSRLKSDPEDYYNELKGTWYLWQNDLDNAISTFEKIKQPEVFYGEHIRSMMFSRAKINESFDTNFMSQNDGTHLDFSKNLILNIDVPGQDVLFDEYYKDNKLLLAKNLQNLEQLAQNDEKYAIIYYYMLGNAWYNMGKTGWFLNTLHYVDNDYRNHVLDSGYYYSDNPKSFTADNFTKNATHYFNKVLESKGSSEVKAKATFMLAKTNYSYVLIDGVDTYSRKVEVRGDHRKYFEQLQYTYGNTDFVKYEVINECSWYRSFLE